MKEEPDEVDGVLRQKSRVIGDVILRLELSCAELLLEPIESIPLESTESCPDERSILLSL